MTKFSEFINGSNNIKNTQNNGVYVAMLVENTQEFNNYFSKHDISISHNLHVTIAYSKKYFDYLPNYAQKITIEPKDIIGYDLFGDDKNILVLKINSTELQEKHQETLTKGATFDFPIYEPHITISYDFNNMDLLDTLQIPNFNIILCCEYSEELID